MKGIADLSPDELHRLIERLTCHAHRKMQRLTWRGARLLHGDCATGGHGPEDLAAEAILAALNPAFGEGRSWNPKTEPDLEKFLMSAIDSRVNNLVTRLDNVKERRAGFTGKSGDEIVIEINDADHDPIKLIVKTEAARIFHEEAIKALEGDATAVEVFECLWADVTKPQEIAELLGISVDEVNNTKKRVIRKLEKCERLMALYRQKGSI